MNPRTLPEWLQAQYPFKSRYLTVPGGHRLHYLDEGQGPTVVFVHGNPTWSFLYRNLIRELRQDFRCIAVDHLGMGLSDKPALYPYTLAQHTENLRLLLQHLRVTRYSLVVHDWGGAIGCGVAVQEPDKVERLLVTNTAAFLGGRVPRRIAICRQPYLGPLLVRGANGFVRGVTWIGVKKRLSASIRRGYRYPYGSWNDRVGVMSFVRDIPQESSHLTRPVLESLASRLPVLRDKPLHLLWGARDWCFDLTFFAEWNRRFPGAEVTVLQHASHLLFEDEPDACLQVARKFMSPKQA